MTPVCLICQSPAAPWLEVAGYAIARCPRCGFAFVWPTPTPAELADYYADRYMVPLTRDANNAGRHAARLADLARYAQPPGRLLEVGASYGYALAVAQARGWQVAGVELAPAASAHARSVLGIEVFTGDLGAAPFPAASFDAAMLWHVLEHTHDPRAQLSQIYSLLRPGGILALRVPNIESLGARLAGRGWIWISPPAHLWYFSASTLPRLLAQHGFEVLEVATLRGDGHNPYQHAIIAAGSQLNTLVRAIRARRQPAPVGQRQVATPTSTPLVQAWVRVQQRALPITRLLDHLSHRRTTRLEAAGLGDELIVYARRPAEAR